MKLFVIYDDSVQAEGRTRNILGKKTFGEMILKRQSMFSRAKRLVDQNRDTEIVRVKNFEEFELGIFPKDAIFLHLLASSAIVMPEDFEILLEKAIYAKENLTIAGAGKVHGGIFKDRAAYEDFLNEYNNQGRIDFLKTSVVETNIFVDLSDYNTLLMFISSGFDARYFNSLQGDAYTVTKSSTDKKKIKMEYSYYWLLPEEMKGWMVMPYNFQESANGASYMMERMPMTDIAIRWTHGAVDNGELKNILDKIFYFFDHRVSKKVTRGEYERNANSLYLTKLEKRISELKRTPEYEQIAELIKVGTEYETIDDIVLFYEGLYRKMMKTVKLAPVSVVGHGDVFFANMLYSKELNLLRLIDPKGALTESELWMDPYYDVAKLSHSICGNYDFFNTGSYTISFNKNMKFDLTIHTDNTRAKEIFREYLEKNGYDYRLVRLYESSLFLSMLPLHIDNPQKVFGFILNAISILKEVQGNV